MKKNKKSKIRIYQDSKELPFWNYKRIVQTGDFYYMIKGYESGDEVTEDLKLLEEKYDEIIQDYVLSNNTKNHDIINYSNYLSAVNEIDKLQIIIAIIDLIIQSNNLKKSINIPEDNSIVENLLKNIKVTKSSDLSIQRKFISDKIQKFRNQAEKSKSEIEKAEKNNNEEQDIDKQFISVCIGLEMHVDPKLISLYEYGVMVDMVIKKAETINK